MAIIKNVSLEKQTNRLLNLLSLIKDQLSNLIKAYDTKDYKLATKIEANDLNVNIEYHYIIDKSTWILTQHTLLGEELRKLLSYNSIAKEFERLGDVISSIAKYLVKSNMKLIAKKEFINELRIIYKYLDDLGETIASPLEKTIMINLHKIKDHHNIYKVTKNEYLKNLATSTNTKEINIFLKEIQLLIRIWRMSVFISNTYEYLIYTLTAKHKDLDYMDSNN